MYDNNISSIFGRIRQSSSININKLNFTNNTYSGELFRFQDSAYFNVTTFYTEQNTVGGDYFRVEGSVAVIDTISSNYDNITNHFAKVFDSGVFNNSVLQMIGGRIKGHLVNGETATINMRSFHVQDSRLESVAFNFSGVQVSIDNANGTLFYLQTEDCNAQTMNIQGNSIGGYVFQQV